MFIVIEHYLHRPTDFWAAFSDLMQKCPMEVRLQGSIVSDTDKIQWMWEAPSIDCLRQWMEPTLAQTCDAWYGEVDPFYAIGASV